MLVLSSCYSTLTVRVHSFDMQKMRESVQYEKETKSEQLKVYQSMLLGDAFSKVQEQMIGAVNKGLENMVENGLFSDAFISTTMQTVTPKIISELSDYRLSMAKVSNALQKSLYSNDSVANQAYLSASADFLLARATLDNFVNSFGTEIGDPSLNQHFSILLKKNSDIDALVINNTYGTSIANDNMASFIAKAPEEYWNRYKTTFYKDETDLRKSNINSSVNVTRITSFIGNSDIAVKMDGPSNFIIKGVRLDADQAYRTSFKVLSQGIKYLTYASGIPFPVNGGTGATAQPKIPEIANLDRNQLQSEELNVRFQQLTDSFLKIIDSYKEDLNSRNDSRRLAAVLAVKQAYLYYRSQLPTQTP